MTYETQAEALADDRCGAELESGEFCGGLPISSFMDYRDMSAYQTPARCKWHQDTVGLSETVEATA